MDHHASLSFQNAFGRFQHYAMFPGSAFDHRNGGLTRRRGDAERNSAKAHCVRCLRGLFVQHCILDPRAATMNITELPFNRFIGIIPAAKEGACFHLPVTFGTQIIWERFMPPRFWRLPRHSGAYLIEQFPRWDLKSCPLFAEWKPSFGNRPWRDIFEVFSAV